MQSDLSEVIFTYAGRIGREHDRAALLGIIADLGRDLVGADRCSIWMIEGEQLVTRVAHGAGVLRMGLTQGLVGNCIRSGQNLLVNGVDDDIRHADAIDEQTGYRTRSVLVVPVRSSDDQIMGAFQALNKPGGFRESDTTLLSLAASYSGQILEGQILRSVAEEARRLSRELEIAHEVQQRLLPNGRIEPAAGLDFAAVCHPASEVGGDYYDYLPLGSSACAFHLGDVSGKGISAALMMASIQASLRALVSRDSGGRPFEILARLNHMSQPHFAAGKYSTLFFGFLDCSTRRLTAVNAGHVYPVLRRADGEVIEIASGGPPIGLFPCVQYEQHEFDLRPHDALICFSDGLCEIEDPDGEMWDEEALRESVVQSAGLNAAETVQSLVNAALGFARGAAPRDDLTVMCVRVTA